jgi:hypothetical protein
MRCTMKSINEIYSENLLSTLKKTGKQPVLTKSHEYSLHYGQTMYIAIFLDLSAYSKCINYR